MSLSLRNKLHKYFTSESDRETGHFSGEALPVQMERPAFLFHTRFLALAEVKKEQNARRQTFRLH